jgi:hypothetical protein
MMGLLDCFSGYH